MLGEHSMDLLLPEQYYSQNGMKGGCCQQVDNYFYKCADCGMYTCYDHTFRVGVNTYCPFHYIELDDQDEYESTLSSSILKTSFLKRISPESKTEGCFVSLLKRIFGLRKT